MIKTVIVEDDLMVSSLNSQFAQQTLAIEIVAVFHTSLDALEYLSSHKVDLMLLDLYMPDISGLELLKKLREQDNHVGAIMITAANDASYIEEALHLGIVDYLVKPFRYERFSMAIRKFLRQRQLMTQEGALSQEDIDKIFSVDNESSSHAKGIQLQTLDTIRRCLKSHPHEFVPADTIASETGLSKVTARRYLNYLIEMHEAVSRVNYLTGGHPSTEYCGR
ncbi:MAG: response regulator [Blautia sp.]|nr:response regulator [Blautia sp.]